MVLELQSLESASKVYELLKKALTLSPEERGRLADFYTALSKWMRLTALDFGKKTVPPGYVVASGIWEAGIIRASYLLWPELRSRSSAPAKLFDLLASLMRGKQTTASKELMWTFIHDVHSDFLSVSKIVATDPEKKISPEEGQTLPEFAERFERAAAVFDAWAAALRL